jgi:fructose-1,6-bisphosphatase
MGAIKSRKRVNSVGYIDAASRGGDFVTNYHWQDWSGVIKILFTNDSMQLHETPFPARKSNRIEKNSPYLYSIRALIAK